MNQAVAVMTYVVFPWSANGNIFVNGVNVAPGGRAIFQSESKLTLVFFNSYEMDWFLVMWTAFAALSTSNWDRMFICIWLIRIAYDIQCFI